LTHQSSDDIILRITELLSSKPASAIDIFYLKFDVGTDVILTNMIHFIFLVVWKYLQACSHTHLEGHMYAQ
jgi:hypothetical protein